MSVSQHSTLSRFTMSKAYVRWAILPTRENKPQQNGVKPRNEHRGDNSCRRRERGISPLTQQRPICGECDQRHECERYTERQHDLTEHECVCGVKTHPENAQRGKQCHCSAQQQGNTDSQKSLHDLGTRVRTHRS